MSEKTSVSYSIGPSLGTLLGVLFVALKLTHVISWPWIWVLAPFWIGLLVTVLIILGVIGVVIAVAVIGAYVKRRTLRRLRAQMEALQGARKNSSY